MDLRVMDLSLRVMDLSLRVMVPSCLRLVPSCLRLVPRSISENPESEITRFRGGYCGIRLFEIERSKDWIAPPTCFEKCPKSLNYSRPHRPL